MTAISNLRSAIERSAREGEQASDVPSLRHPILRSLTEADTEPEHVHSYLEVPRSERTDRLKFVCTMKRCAGCGDTYTI